MLEKISLSIDFEVFDSIKELNSTEYDLMQKAIESRHNVYAPYSNFKVGAAVLLKNGKIIVGNNQENAAYPSGLCAERVAIYQASAIYPKEEIVSIAISGSSEIETELPVAPCGACRQSIAEYEIRQKNPIDILFMGAKGKVVKAKSIKDLLPLLFDGSLL